MRVLDLFSGLGGFSLGLTRAGHSTVAFCERDPYCRAVLAERFPGVHCYDDIRTLSAERLAQDGISPPPELLCGGWPCQDISLAGLGAGLAGERSGLWSEFARLIGELRPRYALMENVAALLARGLGEVLADLAALGYDAEWHCIPAAALGAPHRRDRIWIIAADADRGRCEGERLAQHGELEGASGREPHRLGAGRWRPGPDAADTAGLGAERHRADRLEVAFAPALARLLGCDHAGDHWREWPAESPILRVAHGAAGRLVRRRLEAIGNALLPQIAEALGRAILEVESQRR